MQQQRVLHLPEQWAFYDIKVPFGVTFLGVLGFRLFVQGWGCYHATQAGLKHEMCLLFHPQCWNCRSMPPHSAAPRSRMLWVSALSYSAPWRESDRETVISGID